jgi:hypothetical protein
MGNLTMTDKELHRINIISQVEQGDLDRTSAAMSLRISLRQLDRLRKRLKSYGIRGIVHKGRGKQSNHKMSMVVEQQIIELIKLNYADFGPTLAKEKLYENHQIKISTEKLRQLMQREKLWRARKRRNNKYHPRRPRRSCCGELEQADGSHHRWFEERSDPCVLVAIIDDATNRAYGLFFESETTEAYATIMRRYIARYGCPLALYVDKDSIFRVNRSEKHNGHTQFARMMNELSIRIVCAHSPEAKGRIERLFCTLQDRLVKELRLREISNIESANKYLEEEYWEKHNTRWTVEPNNMQDVHQKTPSEEVMDAVFTLRDIRRVSNSLDFSYNGTLYQIRSKKAHRLAKKNITIYRKFDGSFWIQHEGEILDFKAFKDISQQVPVIDSKEINSFLNGKQKMTAIERYRKRIYCP